MDISETRILVEERMLLSLKEVLSDEDKKRLRWLNDNIVIPPTERFFYGDFQITYYPLSDEWAVSQEGWTIYKKSKEELYELIDGRFV